MTPLQYTSVLIKTGPYLIYNEPYLRGFFFHVYTFPLPVFFNVIVIYVLRNCKADELQQLRPCKSFGSSDFSSCAKGEDSYSNGAFYYHHYLHNSNLITCSEWIYPSSITTGLLPIFLCRLTLITG